MNQEHRDAEQIGSHRMLAELDFPAGDERWQRILIAYGDTIDPIYQLLTSTPTDRAAHPQQKFTIVHLLSRSHSDLLAGAHLAAHCYLPQSYSVLRPVLDSCDLIELFAQDADAATLWTVTEKGHKDFSPAGVRERLGRERHDPVHGHFSEAGSHPRFLGAQISGGWQVADGDPDDRTAVLRIGPTWVWHPATLHLWLFAFNAALALGGAGQHLAPLTENEDAARGAWLLAYSQSIDAASRGSAIVLEALGEDPDSFEALYAPVRDQIQAFLGGPDD